ncbi:MAG: hypothetical protein ACYTGW_07420 [Planctomycetota bacterium]
MRSTKDGSTRPRCRPEADANPGVDASGLKPLPKDLIGRHMTLAAWVLQPKAGVTGEATNAVDVFFKQ